MTNDDPAASVHDDDKLRELDDLKTRALSLTIDLSVAKHALQETTEALENIVHSLETRGPSMALDDALRGRRIGREALQSLNSLHRESHHV